MTYKDWRVYFQANPEDWHSYLILADWLEDQGRGAGHPSMPPPSTWPRKENVRFAP